MIVVISLEKSLTDSHKTICKMNIYFRTNERFVLINH